MHPDQWGGIGRVLDAEQDAEAYLNALRGRGTDGEKDCRWIYAECDGLKGPIIAALKCYVAAQVYCTKAISICRSIR